MADKRTYASCRVGDLLVGVEVDAVQEVTFGSALTPVPLAPFVVNGLLNLRGQIVTAIDLRRSLGLPDRAVDARPIHVVLRAEGGAVSLLVDSVGDVLEVDEEDFERASGRLQSGREEVVTGAYKLDRGLLLILDTERLVEKSDANRN